MDLSQLTFSYVSQRYRLDPCGLSIEQGKTPCHELILDELRSLLILLLYREVGS